MAVGRNKIKDLFKKYISTRKVLIADPNSSSRAGIAKALIDMGAVSTNVSMASSFETALQEVASKKPEVVICDYDLGKRCGLDLLQNQREQQPDAKDSLFVLVTGNSSQSAVAQAAEEDVDTYILKPYTIDILRQSIMKAAIAKINPSPYYKTVEAGKDLLGEGKIDEAIALFDKAKTLDPKPALACYYRGQAETLRELLTTAKDDFGEGLKFNKIHYKCMVGLYDILMKEKQFVDAYDVVKKISRYFPANPQRLSSVLRLAVMTQSYEDIERYYQIFSNLDERHEELIRYICAALIVCGKHYLANKVPSRAMDLFNKAALASKFQPKVLSEIIHSLLAFDLGNEAEKFLKKFDVEQQNSLEFKVVDYEIAAQTLGASALIEQGRKLLKEDFKAPAIYAILIEKSAEVGFRDSAESLADEAAKLYPKQADLFKARVDTGANAKDKAAAEKKAS